jgi:predicted transcriptional regulator
MKTLSLKQPWAELILQGKKKIEIRKWNTKFRGEFLIHASGNIDKEAMKKFCFKENELPTKAIVGKARLTEVKRYKNKEEFEKDKSLHLAGIEWGSYGFVLENPERFKEPIKTRGSLGFWNFESESKRI